MMFSDYEDWAGDPEGTFWQKWFGGVIVPMICLYLAIQCWITQEAFLPGSKGMKLPLEGTNAIVMGFLCFSIGLFLFCHYYLVGTKHYNIRGIGKVIGVIGIIIPLVYLFVNILVLS